MQSRKIAIATAFALFFYGIAPIPSVRAAAKEDWVKYASFVTYFNAEERGRSRNIQTAAALIDGITLQAYGEFSFNQTVGERTKEAGFQQAKIIVNGEYVLGVGGGVCQVSTTLYNAALKAGLEAVEWHAHSLRVAYVPPSRDAMVSTHSDLKLYNPHAYPVRLRTQVQEGSVRVCFYASSAAVKTFDRYELSSVVVEEISPPPPVVKEGEREEILRSPKNGVKSEGYIERYAGDALLYKKRIRSDEYRPVQGIVVKKSEKTTP